MACPSDLFGEPEHAMTPAERKAFMREHGWMSKAGQAKGYAALPGTGPASETCKSCKHIYRHRMAKTYIKCDLMQRYWTGGPGSDVRAGSPACSRWEASADAASDKRS